jgi:predicted ABC-type sugar transport system permease subunit
MHLKYALVVLVTAFAGWYLVGGVGIIFGGVVGAMVVSESMDEDEA